MIFNKRGEIELEVVINTSFGGFQICCEMALWLFENKGWNIITEAEYDYKKKSEYPLNTLVDAKDLKFIYSPHDDSIKFRTHPDLIECVRALKELYKEESEKYYRDRQYSSTIDDLEVETVTITIGVEDYYDGKERVFCNNYTG